LAQIIQKPPESKMGMLKAEVDILTKSDHPNMCGRSALPPHPRRPFRREELAFNYPAGVPWALCALG